MGETVFKLRSLVSCKFVNTLNALFAFDVTSLPNEISATCALKRSIGILEPYFAANSTLTKMYYYRPFQVSILFVKVNVKLISGICKNSSLFFCPIFFYPYDPIDHIVNQCSKYFPPLCTTFSSLRGEKNTKLGHFRVLPARVTLAGPVKRPVSKLNPKLYIRRCSSRSSNFT